jgi:oligoribonuclease NrnB/cAMP/cGMP phosphodiesterase (DHH superfamily)
MSSLKDVVRIAIDNGFCPDSKILNITHYDLDGYLSTSNITAYLNNPDQDLNFFGTGYDRINLQVSKMIEEPDNREFKDAEFVLITDISVTEEVARYFQDIKSPIFLVLDHHDTAFSCNKFEHCHIREDNTQCGSEITLNFLKEVARVTNDPDTMERLEKLTTLNKIATDYDLWFWPKKETEMFEGKILTSIPDRLNRLFYTMPWSEKPNFIKRWSTGWGDGFTQQEIQMVDESMRKSIRYTDSLELIDLSDNVGFVVANEFLNDASAILREKWEVALIYNSKSNKISGRITDDSVVHIGEIFKEVEKKFGFAGGGHAKAGGVDIIDKNKLGDVLELIVDMAEEGIQNGKK